MLSLEERVPLFWKKVEKTPTCWIWTGYRDLHGYGMFAVAPSRPEQASRVVWKLTVGSIPQGMSVCHRCDNPPCVRPDHLFLGTHRENMRDARAKGRMRLGENHPGHKLSAHEIRTIRDLGGSGLSHSEIARRFGVSRRLIGGIISRRRWAWVS